MPMQTISNTKDISQGIVDINYRCMLGSLGTSPNNNDNDRKHANGRHTFLSSYSSTDTYLVQINNVIIIKIITIMKAIIVIKMIHINW